MHYADLSSRVHELVAEYRAEVDLLLAQVPAGSPAAEALAAARARAHYGPRRRIFPPLFADACAE